MIFFPFWEIIYDLLGNFHGNWSVDYVQRCAVVNIIRELHLSQYFLYVYVYLYSNISIVKQTYSEF